MDLAHLRYAVEIARTHSISQAAENLYMGQQNLSRAIKDLEEELQVQIFRRTSHGVSVTLEGEEFLRHAHSIVQQADEIEEIYKNRKQPKQRFSLCAPRASYISQAFVQFSRQAALQSPDDAPLEFTYKETNSMKAIHKVLNNEYNLAIVRYQTIFDKYFRELFDVKKLHAEIVAEFPCLVTLSAQNPLAQKETLLLSELRDGPEILHADPYVPSLPPSDTLKAESPSASARKIFVFERGTQFMLLEQLPGAFMWTSRLPQAMLDKYRLVQRPCADHTGKSRDVLLYRKSYQPNELDELFMAELSRSRQLHLDRTERNPV